MKLQLKFGLILSTISILSYVSFANAETKVIASIKPLHSLVSYVMDGVGKPGILVDGSSSPHTFQLKPSHAEMLQEADIVFWIGEDLESFLESPLESIATNSKHIALMESDEIELLKFREKNIFEDHDDHDDHADEHDDDHDEHDDHADEHGDDHADEHGDDHADGHGDHGDHGFEWAGVFDLTEGTYNWSFAKVGGEYADPAMKMVILMSDEIESSEERAEELLESSSSTDRNHSSTLSANDSAFMLNFDESRETTVFSVEIKEAGKYAFFTEHMPFEFEADEHFFKDLSGNDVEPIAQEPDSGHHDHHHGHAHGEFDIHFWLDPEIAKTIVMIVSSELSELDPSNASIYNSNATKALSEIDQLIAATKGKINSNAKYVVFHDAYQYFEKRFGIEVVGALTVNPEVLPGAKQLSEIREAIEHENVNCLFSEPQFNPTIAETIAADTGVKAAVIDPLGAELELGKDLYFELINDLSSSFENC